MDKKCNYCSKPINSDFKFCPYCGNSTTLSKEEALKQKAAEGDEEAKREFEADERFTQAVIRFADAFLALTPEEQAELQAYTEGRCAQAEQEYKNRNKK